MLACSKCARAADYSDAESKAQEAFLKQSGLQKLQDDTLHYMQHTYIDPYWFTKDAEVALGGAYHIYRSKRIELKLTKNWTLAFTPNSYGAGWRLPF